MRTCIHDHAPTLGFRPARFSPHPHFMSLEVLWTADTFTSTVFVVAERSDAPCDHTPPGYPPRRPAQPAVTGEPARRRRPTTRPPTTRPPARPPTLDLALPVKSLLRSQLCGEFRRAASSHSQRRMMSAGNRPFRMHFRWRDPGVQRVDSAASFAAVELTVAPHTTPPPILHPCPTGQA